jgi:iron complex transport system substrate-binding protein
MRFEEGLRVDLLVENRVVVEFKSVEKLAAVHAKQTLTYVRSLRAAGRCVRRWGS